MNQPSPWANLPTRPPYILPEDKKVIESHKHYLNLRLDTLPEPVVGGLNTAEVVFLALNPGFTQADVDVNMQIPEFIETTRNNLADPFDSNFHYFDELYKETGGYEWWSDKLKPLIAAGVTTEQFRRGIMIIEYFPYHSTNYKHISTLTPSQHYSFDLVREAIKRDKIIVIMRSKSFWLNAVPELTGYSYMTLNSSLNVVVSPNNIGELNFKAILQSLTRQ